MNTYTSATPPGSHTSGDNATRNAAGITLSELGKRIKLARSQRSQRELADLVRVHPNTIGKLERGEAAPDAALLLAIAEATDTSAAWLLLGDRFAMTGYIPPNRAGGVSIDDTSPGSPIATVVPLALHAVELGDFVYVPHFDVHASAGTGTDFFNHIEKVQAMRPFDSAFIRRDLGIAHNEIALLNIAGRSMEPLLHSKDVSLVDRRDREANVEGIHVIRLDGAVYVKALQRLPGRVLRVTSKNPDFEPYDIKPTEDDQRDFAVLGRVRWAGITLT